MTKNILKEAMRAVDAAESPFVGDGSTDFVERKFGEQPPSVFGNGDDIYDLAAEKLAAKKIEAQLAAGVERAISAPDDNPKTAMGLKKPGTAAIPPVAVLELGAVMANGAAKYGRFNWREKTVTTSVYTDAIDRHLLAFRDGETHDRESGRPHLAHVMACCSILLDAQSIGRLNDDRIEGAASEWINEQTKA